MPTKKTNSLIEWAIKTGSWTATANTQSYDGVQFTSDNHRANGSTVIRCTFNGVTRITFRCIYNGENNYDYLTIGALDTTCTRSQYFISLKGQSGIYRDITFQCNEGEHYVEFCYSKDGSGDTLPDCAVVYVSNVVLYNPENPENPENE